MSYDRENERARATHTATGIAALALAAFGLGVFVGGLPYHVHVPRWQLGVTALCIGAAATFLLVGSLVLQRDTRRLRRRGDELRAQRQSTSPDGGTGERRRVEEQENQ